MEPVAVSINDAAKALSLSRSSIYSLIREKRLDIVKLGRRTLVKIESIHKLIEDAE